MQVPLSWCCCRYNIEYPALYATAENCPNESNRKKFNCVQVRHLERQQHLLQRCPWLSARSWVRRSHRNSRVPSPDLLPVVCACDPPHPPTPHTHTACSPKLPGERAHLPRPADHLRAAGQWVGHSREVCLQERNSKEQTRACCCWLAACSVVRQVEVGVACTHTHHVPVLVTQAAGASPPPSPCLAAVNVCVVQYPVTAASLGAAVLIGRIGYCEVSRRHRVGGGEAGSHGRKEGCKGGSTSTDVPFAQTYLHRYWHGIHTVPAHWCQQWCWPLPRCCVHPFHLGLCIW